MATQIVELTGDEAALLRSLDRAVKKQLEYEQKLRDTGDAGDAAGTQIEAALARVERESNKALKGMLAELKTMGPEGAAAADALQGHFVETGKAGFRSIDSVLAQIKLIDPQAAAAAAAARTSLDDAADQSKEAFHETLKLLQQLGPEGAEAAKQIRTDMDTAAARSVGDFDQLLTKLAELDPVAASSAATIREKMTAAANDTERQFRDVLDELRAMGPEGRKAADEIKAKFVEAGHISERSIEDIAKGFEKLDPEAAKAANAVIANMRRSGNDGGKAFADMRATAVTEFKSIVAALVGVDSVQGAIQAVTDALEAQRAKMREVANTQVEAAKVQQEAFKNLAAMELVQQSELIRTKADEISGNTGVGYTHIVEALQSAISAGATEEQAIAATEAAAKVNIHTPENTKVFARGAVTMSQVLGTSDPREAMNFNIAASDPSPIDEPGKFNALMPATVRAAMNFTTNPDKIDAAKEATAIAVTLGRLAEDKTGDSTGTASTQLNAQLDEFFKDRQDDPRSQFDRLQRIREDEELRKKFLDSLRGEERFKPFMTQMVTAGSEAVALMENIYKALPGQGVTNLYEQKVQTSEAGSPETATATFRRRSETNREAARLRNTEVGALAEVRQQVVDNLTDALPSGLTGVFESLLADAFTKRGGLRGTTAAEEAVSAMAEYQKREQVLRGDGIQASDIPKLDLLKKARTQLLEYMEKQIGFGKLDEEGVQRAIGLADSTAQSIPASTPENREIIAQLQQLQELFKRVADSNEKMVGPAQATAENTGKLPPVTGAIGATQP